MITCTKRYTDIPFAHRQPLHTSHCRLNHGHNWSFEFEFATERTDENGFVIDFGGLHRVKDFLAQLDHATVLCATDPWLNNDHFKVLMPDFKLVVVPDCSCEGLAAWAAKAVNKIVQDMTKGRVFVRRCTCFEDSRNSATAS